MTETVTQTSRIQRALDALVERAGAASRVTSCEAAGLSLAQTTAVLDAVMDVWDLVGQMLGPVMDRVEQINERELIERQGESGRAVLDDAVLHLSYGRDGLAAARALVAVALAEIVSVEQGARSKDEGLRPLLRGVRVGPAEWPTAARRGDRQGVQPAPLRNSSRGVFGVGDRWPARAWKCR